MEQERASTETQSLSVRLARLEERLHLVTEFDRMRSQQAWLTLQDQINDLRQQVSIRGMGAPLGAVAWLKILAAVLLPYLALLMTGSIQFAQKVGAVLQVQ